ncbi:AraC family transcriptional regulator [Paenibacillus allorhizosphaerae]|uniref:HTH-type transcriptional activator RhaR n=1 Tax=Paenibacillus allorhizosphaerae TaxID=2849866 RepID=A0ABN7TNI8_9BACL|nr:AraC family transcriptional regulator [Paenibacillus allorhizosphaerae]CAG7648647.1 HTH-type transcriptional activator RhaR [Paenibacillus allorhizosphaerae]
MIYYTKEHFLESPDFPFHITPYTFRTNAIAPHKHEFIECVFVAEGEGEHIYRGESYPIARGDFFVIEPQVEHGYRVTGSVPMAVYNVLFLPELLEAELRQLSQVTPFIRFFYLEPLLRVPSDFQYHLKLSVNEGLETKFVLDRIVGEFSKKELGYRLCIKAMLMELFIFLSRCYEKRMSEPFTSGRDEKTVMEWVCEFTKLHYAQPIMMEQIYQMCGMSAAAFTAKFKQYAGKTFTEFRNEVRIGVSCELLRHSGDKIIHIAQEVGFNDLSHFNKAFKQMTGMTPGQYRTKFRTSG